MAMSETTKKLTLQERKRLLSRYDKNAKDIDALETQATALRKVNVEIAKNISALKKDIPAPKPVTQ